MPVGAVKVVGQKRTALATFLPAGTEHEMVNNQLAPSVEKISQGFLTVRSLENILLIDLDHRQLAPPGANRRRSRSVRSMFSRDRTVRKPWLIFSTDGAN